MAKRKANGWRNRIVGQGEQAADQFLAHPGNWRLHDAAQEAALLAVLDTVGWVQRVVVSKNSGYVLDGHLRIRAAIGRGDQTPVPYIEVDVTPDEEALILATLDPIAAMAGRDDEVYARLVAGLPEDLTAVLATVGQEAATAGREPEPVPESWPVVVACRSAEDRESLLARLRAEGLDAREG